MVITYTEIVKPERLAYGGYQTLERFAEYVAKR